MATTTPDSDVIAFEAQVAQIEGTRLVVLPPEASKRLPSRGQVAVTATLNGRSFPTVVEPDGRRGHWLRVADGPGGLRSVKVGHEVTCQLVVAPEWPEPEVPDDLDAALGHAPAGVRALWQDITPMARWEWVRWVRATRNPDTRAHRVEVAISKLQAGKRRPCCFDLSSCTDPELSRSGKLRSPEV